MSKNIYLVPRWAGRPHSDWYDSFSRAVAVKLPDADFTCLESPRWDDPDTGGIIRFLDAEMPVLDEQSIVMGHSVGCLAALRVLERRAAGDPGLRIGGMLLVAAWFTVDNPWPTLLPWMRNEDLDDASIKRACPRIRVLLSDNDPHTRDHLANKRLWEDRLGARVTIHHGCAHFNGPDYPEIVDTLLGITDGDR